MSIEGSFVMGSKLKSKGEERRAAREGHSVMKRMQLYLREHCNGSGGSSPLPVAFLTSRESITSSKVCF